MAGFLLPGDVLGLYEIFSVGTCKKFRVRPEGAGIPGEMAKQMNTETVMISIN